MITRSELKRYGSLAQKKFRDEHGLFLVEGSRAVREACQAHAGFDVVLATRRFLESREGGGLAPSFRRAGRAWSR